MAIDQKQMSSKRLENGDVIKVSRKLGRLPLYDHYGIYVEKDNKVIHYTEPEKAGGEDLKRFMRCGDSSGVVRETTLDYFLAGAKSFFVCRYPKERPHAPLCWFKKETFKVRYDEIKDKGGLAGEIDPQSPGAKAVKKAKERIGNVDYNVLWRNCEHFAVDCRYGYQAAAQVQGWATTVFTLILSAPLLFAAAGKMRHGDLDGSEEKQFFFSESEW